MDTLHHVHTLLQFDIRTFGPVWYTPGCFQMSYFLCKSTAKLLPSRYVLTINEPFHEVLCEFVSQGAFKITLIEVMSFRFYLIKRDFLRVFKFDSSYFWCHLRYKLTQYLIWKVSLMIKTYLVDKSIATFT